MEGFRFDVGCLLAVDFDNYTLRSVADQARDAYGVVEKVLGIEIDTFFEWPVFGYFNGVDAVEGEYVDLRGVVGGFFADEKPAVAIFFQEIGVDDD